MASKLTQYLVEFSKFELTRPISDKIRIAEIIAVILTGLGKFIIMDLLGWRFQFVIIAIVSWSLYIFFRYKKDKLVLKDWGFRVDNFSSVFKMVLPFVITSIMLCIIIGTIQDSINLTWHIIPILVTYPIWGTVQQFLTIGIVAGNLSTLNTIKLKKTIVILITAVLFALVHYPSLWLMSGTFILALFYGYIYLKSKNLFVLGIIHGWLGALFYYSVLNQDPFADVFLKLFN